ncbi:MAG: hypothetical protein ACO3C1_07555, partial [Ilumatobacteraceae bacterium]
MSTIRRHGVAFHLIPTPSDTLWLEVIRESDGAVLVSEPFRGDDDAELAPAVDEWIADIVLERVGEIPISACRVCGNRRREMRHDDTGRIRRDHVIEWEFDLCITCAAHIEQAVPWIVGWVEERYFPDDD